MNGDSAACKYQSYVRNLAERLVYPADSQDQLYIEYRNATLITEPAFLNNILQSEIRIFIVS